MKLFRTIASQPTPEKIFTTHVKPAKPHHVPAMNSAAEKADLKKSDGMTDIRVFPQSLRGSKHGDLICVARTEFDIAPDWRTPMRSVVPMTQITRCTPTQGRLPRLSKHMCLHSQREFVIHPEWIIHWKTLKKPVNLFFFSLGVFEFSSINIKCIPYSCCLCLALHLSESQAVITALQSAWNRLFKSI